jgi:hypothetical protein
MPARMTLRPLYSDILPEANLAIVLIPMP